MTFVLIHGGGATGRFWDRLRPLLDRPALAVDLPGRAGKAADLGTLSVEQETASVVADIRADVPTGPVVLVAHSSGGLVVPGVVEALEGRVGAVVLNAALVPTEGGCGIDCMKPRHREGLVATREAAVLPEAQEEMVLRLPPPTKVVRVDSGHLYPVTAPTAFAALLAGVGV
jgi:pimeloyl-ACP methyl ester carboxylesterase